MKYHPAMHPLNNVAGISGMRAHLPPRFRDSSPVMHAGASFVLFIQALMAFEEDKLAEALRALQRTEKLCDAAGGGGGFARAMRRRFGRRKKSEVSRGEGTNNLASGKGAWREGK